MSDFNDDMARGCLENGEPLEARYGTGYWTQMPELEPEYEGGECPFCGQEAWYCDGSFESCEECGKTHEDTLPESEVREMFDVKKVVIEGEMPVSCKDCWLMLWDWGDRFCCARIVSETGDNDVEEYYNLNTRPDWCPLFQVDTGRVYQWTGDEWIDVLQSWMPPKGESEVRDE